MNCVLDRFSISEASQEKWSRRSWCTDLGPIRVLGEARAWEARRAAETPLAPGVANAGDRRGQSLTGVPQLTEECVSWSRAVGDMWGMTSPHLICSPGISQYSSHECATKDKPNTFTPTTIRTTIRRTNPLSDCGTCARLTLPTL